MSNAFETAVLSRILALKEEEIGEFIREAMTSKRLSAIVHDLNTRLLHGAPEERGKAEEALARLGFVA